MISLHPIKPQCCLLYGPSCTWLWVAVPGKEDSRSDCEDGRPGVSRVVVCWWMGCRGSQVRSINSRGSSMSSNPSSPSRSRAPSRSSSWSPSGASGSAAKSSWNSLLVCEYKYSTPMSSPVEIHSVITMYNADVLTTHWWKTASTCTWQMCMNTIPVYSPGLVKSSSILWPRSCSLRTLRYCCICPP